jgi:hypothetical protein
MLLHWPMDRLAPVSAIIEGSSMFILFILFVKVSFLTPLR